MRKHLVGNNNNYNLVEISSLACCENKWWFVDLQQTPDMDVLIDEGRNETVMTESTSQALLTDEGLPQASSLNTSSGLLKGVQSQICNIILSLLYTLFPYPQSN